MILLLAQAILSISFGYNAIAIARKMQNKVARISILSVILVTIISLLVSYFHLNYLWIAVSVLIGAVFYTFSQARLGSKILAISDDGLFRFESIISSGSILAIACILTGILINQLIIFSLIGFIIFIIFNREKLKFIRDYAINRNW